MVQVRHKITTGHVLAASYGLSMITVMLAVVAWGQSLEWQIFGTSTYLLFPIFGLVAFSLLWSQYAAITLKKYSGSDGHELKMFFSVTGWLILLAILLHPGLLIWQLWRDGAGLPPGSELKYVIPSLKFFVVLGFINLIILLLFELRRYFAKKPWWQYFAYVVDIAMVSIFIHGLKLGTQLHHGWYRVVWFVYGVSLLAMLAMIHATRFGKTPGK